MAFMPETSLHETAVKVFLADALPDRAHGWGGGWQLHPVVTDPTFREELRARLCSMQPK